MLRHTGMSIADIRNMEYHDFRIHLRIALVAECKDRDFKMTIAGAKSKSKTESLKDMYLKGGPHKMTINKRFDPKVGDFI